MHDIPFIKMHGLGNDFVIIDLRQGRYNITPQMIRVIADRHRGVGCDQLVLIDNAKNADCYVRFFNADGNESGACGNASRCVAALMMSESGKDKAEIETPAAVLSCTRVGQNRISINMGQPGTKWQQIPLAHAMETLHLDIAEGELKDPTAVSMGNPHIVFFVPDVAVVDLPKLGPKLENHAWFPERTNVEAAQIVSPEHIRLRVWERGSGETLACGTGACATAVAAHLRGLTGRDVTVELPGGALQISILASGEVVMAGEVCTSFTGTIELGMFK